MNCGNVTAIFRRFMERLLGYTYWPWGQPAPARRSRVRHLKAVLVTTSAMPALMMFLFTGASTALHLTATMLGARTVGKLWLGLVGKPRYVLSKGALEKARRMGMRLA
jgi:hypothetical protein